MNTKYHYGHFPPKITLDNEIHTLVNQARTELGRYDGFLTSMPNRDTLLSPLFMQEAVLSSQIEGTYSTLTEVLEFQGHNGEQKNISKERKQDLTEVINYRYALSYADKQINKKFSLSQRLLKNTHKELMQSVRGKDKTPGEYRKIPVWIGGITAETARFVPIDAQKIPDAMSQLETYLHCSKDYDDLIKVAILHAEFESIHPFLDGNGRLGRLFIPLYLADKKLIVSPSFYISNYFEKNRDSYYDLLLNISKYNNWLDWCKFFLKGIIEQAKNNLIVAQKITNYYQILKQQIPTISKSQYGIVALDFIFNKNYFNSTDFYTQSKIPKPTAQRLLQVFEQKKILTCSRGTGRIPNFYVFEKLIDIADGK